MEAAEKILAHIAGGHDMAKLLLNLATFDVPDAIVAEILAAADDLGITHEVAAHLFAATLVDRLKAELTTGISLESDSVRRFMAILGDRRVRALRLRIVRMLSTCTADAWGEEP